jgi:hypothetical protein
VAAVIQGEVDEFASGTEQRDTLNAALTKKVDQLERCTEVDGIFFGTPGRQGCDNDASEASGRIILDARGQIE